VIEWAIIVSKGQRLSFEVPTLDSAIDRSSSAPRTVKESSMDLPYTEAERLERDKENILAALRLASGKISGADGAAELLGIKPTTLATRMKKFAIKRKD